MTEKFTTAKKPYNNDVMDRVLQDIANAEQATLVHMGTLKNALAGLQRRASSCSSVAQLTEVKKGVDRAVEGEEEWCDP